MRTTTLTRAHLPAVERLAPHLLPHVLWCLHTTYATVYGLVRGEAVLGVATALRYAPHTQVEAFHLLPSLLHGDAPALLLQALLQQLRAQGCVHAVAYVPPGTEAPWLAQGFVPHEPWLRYSGGTFLEPVHPEVVALEPAHYLALLHMDRRATGMHRAPLLLEHTYLGKVYVRAGHVAGFALPLLGNGLVVATDAEAGLELQRWVLPVRDAIVLPAANHLAAAHLAERGYHGRAAAVRLVYGHVPAAPELIYAW